MGFTSLQATRDIGTTPERNNDDVMLRRRSYRREHVVLIFGIHNQVRSTLRRTAAHTEQVAETLAIRVHQTLITTIVDLIDTQPQAQLSKEAVMPNCLAQLDVID